MNKVVLLAPTPPPMGGIAQWTVRMMNAKLNNGWQVRVVDEKIVGTREFFGDRKKYNYLLEIKRCLSIWIGLIRALKDKEARIVHSCIPANTMPLIREFICALITKIRRRKFVIHFRCTVPNVVSGKLNCYFLKRICNISDCVIVLNKQSEEYINKTSRTKTQIIPNFVEIDEIASEHIIKDKIRRVLYIGGCIESKGCLDLIAVARAFPDIEFKLIGKAERKVSEAAKLVNNVILTGPMDHSLIKTEMKNADIFAFLTYFRSEGFSNSLAEAMASGLPCLATDWASNRDMLEGKGGVIIPIKSPIEAIHAIGKMQSPETRREQSIFNINKVYTTYSNKVVERQYVECYEELTNENTIHN